MTRLDAGFRIRDVDGSRLSGIPSRATPRVIVPGPARRNGRMIECLPMSIRYMVAKVAFRYQNPDTEGLGNRQRNVLPADVWIVGNQYNKTAVYSNPVAIANPTWRINNLTNKDIEGVQRLQDKKRAKPLGR